VSRTILRRLIAAPLLVWLVATLTFAVVHLAPGSYADAIDNPRMTPEAREAARQRFGLDQPGHVRYLRWLAAITRLDLGTSLVFKRSVAEVLGDALPPTLLLAGAALLVDFLLGIAAAGWAAARPGGWVDRAVSGVALVISGTPPFWFAGMAILIFATLLGWFPASHMTSVGAEAWPPAARAADILRHLVLPAGVLGVMGAAVTARYLRGGFVAARTASWTLAARERGIPERRILWAHVIRPSLAPAVTLLGLSLPALVAGSLVIEVVFAWPGMGRVMWQAALARDTPLVMACTVLGAGAVVLGNLAADLLYAAMDPRARTS
jgi:peptide/nickel transport system permease protein